MMSKLIENPVFICGHRKGGTSLFLKLLDNHPELFVYPADTGFFYKYFPFCSSKEISNEEKTEFMVDRVLAGLKIQLDRLSHEDLKEVDFDMDVFNNDFREIVKTTSYTPKEVLLSLIQAFEKSYNSSPQMKKWVQKTTSTEIFALEIFQWFPNAKFIHIVRDPRDNWGSLKSGWEKRYHQFNDCQERLLQSVLDRGKLGLEFARSNEEIIGKERYKVIKFEDLTTNPEEIMKEVCDFLEISFSETMMVPTTCGKLWPGNNFEGLNFKGISNVNSGRWKERITDHEGQLIEFYCGEIMEYFNYPLIYSTREKMVAASEHYKWYNFAQPFSYTTVSEKGLDPEGIKKLSQNEGK